MTPDAQPVSHESDPCDRLGWDSGFFGFGVARVRGNVLNAARAAEIDDWCRRTGTALLYFLAEAGDGPSLRAAEEAGFHLAEIRMTFVRDGGPPPGRPIAASSPNVRAFATADLPALRRIARASYTDSRFYQDPGIPREKADELFDVWTSTFCREHPDATLVAEVDGQVAGYVAFEPWPVDRRSGRITLIAVDEAFRGRGVGRALVEAAVAHGTWRGLPRVGVVTQGRNVPAQRLYQRCGFVVESVQLQYHKWCG